MIDLSMLLPILAAFLAAGFTLMTGFGLGTILLPVFLLFYDVKVAILIVAVVHLSNNLLKLSLFKENLNLEILKRFGMLTLVGAFIGAYLQGSIDSAAVKVILGIVLIFLGLKEVLPSAEQIRLPKKIDFIGGFLSGLLGGFVGNQGAMPIPLMSPICSGHVARLRKRVSAGCGDCTVSGRLESRLISFCA